MNSPENLQSDIKFYATPWGLDLSQFVLLENFIIHP